jgi:hypothetical protein
MDQENIDSYKIRLERMTNLTTLQQVIDELKALRSSGKLPRALETPLIQAEER